MSSSWYQLNRLQVHSLSVVKADIVHHLPNNGLLARRQKRPNGDHLMAPKQPLLLLGWLWLITLCFSTAQTSPTLVLGAHQDLGWAENVRAVPAGSGPVSDSLTLGNASLLTTPSGPFLRYWLMEPGSSLVLRRATVLASCEQLTALSASFRTRDELVALPAPAIWVSELQVNHKGATQTFINCTFSCVQPTHACRQPGQPAAPAPPLTISSEWQLLAVLGELHRASAHRTKTCLPTSSYTVLLTRNISLTAALPLLPASPYTIAPNLTLAPANPAKITVLDLAEVWNLTRPLWEDLGTSIVMQNLTLVNLATAPPFAITFPVWAVNLGSRGAASFRMNDSLPLQLHNCKLVVPDDELRYVGTFASFYLAPTSDAIQLANWLRFAVKYMANFRQLDPATLLFDEFIGLGARLKRVTLTSKTLPGFPLMHTEAGLARLMDSPLDAYPYVIMVDNEAMLLDFTQQSRLDEAVLQMKAAQYDVASINIVLALTSSMRLTPEVWQAAGRVIGTSVTIQAWPQSMPISLDMGNTTDLLTIRDTSSASLTFKDLTLTGLPAVAPWSPDMPDVNLALQGAVHTVKFERSTPRINFKRATLAVSPQELSLRSSCLDGAQLAGSDNLEARCLEAKLFVPQGASTVNGSLLHISPPPSSPQPPAGWGTVLMDVSFTSLAVVQARQLPGTAQAPRPDLDILTRVWQGKASAGDLTQLPGYRATAAPGSSSTDGNRHLGAIIGGVVGGVAGVAALVVAALLLSRRQRQGQDSTHKADTGKAGGDNQLAAGPRRGASDHHTPDMVDEDGQVQVRVVSEGGADHGQVRDDVQEVSSTSEGPPPLPLLPQHEHHDTDEDVMLPLEPHNITRSQSAARAAQRKRGFIAGQPPPDPLGPAPREVEHTDPGAPGADEATMSASALIIRSLSAPQPSKLIGYRRSSNGRGSVSTSTSGRHPSRPLVDVYPVTTPSSDAAKSLATEGTRSPVVGEESCKHSSGPWATDSLSASNSGRTRRLSLVSELSQMTREMEAKICDQQLEIVGVIGHGGYSTVYRGIWQGLLVAVKTVIFARGTDNKRMALQEAAISKSISHPNIVATYAYDLEPIGPGAATVSLQQGLTVVGSTVLAASGLTGSGSSEWRLYLVMEYCDARSLHHEIKEGRLKAGLNGVPHMSTVLELAYQIATGMQHLHSKHIIHGDLKPENVLLKRQPAATLGVVVKLADFGLSVSMSEPQSHVSNWYKGTPFYVSPEVCSTRKMSKASDVFAFGVILWELYHGRLVWRRCATTKDLEVQPDFPSFPATCPPMYAQLTAACIQEDPANRPKFEQVLNTLHVLAFDVQAAQRASATSSQVTQP